MKRRNALRLLAGSLSLSRVGLTQGVPREKAARKPVVLFLSGETEYRSEATLTRLAEECESRHGMRCKVMTPASKRDFDGLDSLEDADLAVLFLNSLALPPAQLAHFRAYLGSNKPLVALRTTTHAFDTWKEFGPEVLGAGWQYDYGSQSSTDVAVIPAAAAHPILQGVPKQFRVRAPLYHVLPLSSSVTPLLLGTVAGESSRPERVPNPVAWTRSYKSARVFYTSLGHPEDFDVAAFRTLLANGIHWALGRPSPKSA